ncbi:gastric mucin [Schistosoma japonicum]|nr:gastric mucin [Schistosoma japonicum]KAH8849990.1 gastric mucin [Schistosoma japonicum]
MNESPIVICAPTSCPTISNSSCGSSFEGSVCHSGISSVAVPIVSGLSSSVLCPTLSITSAVSPIPPSSLSLTSLRNTVNSLNLSVPSSSHNPVILPSSASLLVQSVNSSNPVSGIHSIPTITSNSLVINDLENPNITVPMTCKNEYLSGSMTNSSFSYSSVLPVGTSTICPNLNFSAISSQTVEIIDPTQNLSSSIPTSTPATLSLQSNVLTSNQMHSENVLGFDAESGTRSVTNPTLPPCFPLNLMPISPNGDFPTTQINFPGLPPVLLQVLPLPGVKMGEHYTINVPTQLIWDGICSALASGGAVNGGPIVLSITPTSLPSHSNSPMSTVPTSYTMTNQAPTHIPLCNPSNGFINSTLPQVGVPVSTVIPYSTLSVGSLTTTVTTANVVNTKLPGVIVNSLLSNPVSAAGGAKRMRAIAPKPSNVSVVATLGIRPTSASTTLSKSGAKRHGLVTPISGVNGIMSSCTSLQSNHSSIPNIGTLTAAPTPPKLLHSTSKKVSLPLVNFSSSLVRSGRGRRRGGVGQQPVPTTFVTSAHASPICITNSVNSVMGINSDTSNVCSLQASVSLPLSSPSSLSSFYSTQSIFVPPTTNPGSLLPPGPIPPTFLFGNPLHNAPPITMPSGVAPFLFQSALPISNSCSQFSNSVFSPATCTASISPSTSCPLAVVRSLPSVSSATIFATNNAPTMASLDPTTGLVTYYPSPCIPMNSPYGPTISSSDSSSINISTICSQPNQTLGLQPSSQSGPVMYPIQTQHLLSNQIVPTIFPNMHTDITGSNAFDNTSFLQSFGPSLMDSSCISSNVQISSESAIIPSHMACQNAFLASASNFHSNGNNGTIPLFSSLPTSSIALPGLEVGTTTCETNGLTDDGGCLAKDDLISLAWHLTQMEDDFETHGKQNPDVIMNQTEDENNGMFEDFLQVYSQNTTGFNYGSDLGYQSHILDPSSVNPSSSVLDKDVILLDNEPECRTDFENPDVGTHLPCSSEESTGNADIDALLAAAAMVGAASGVGDAQSAVAVPLPSSSLASVNHQDTISSECDSSYPTNKDDVHDDIHVEFSSSRIPVHSTNCRFSPLLVPISAEDSVDGLKETKPDDLLPSDLFDDFSKTEANDQFPSETSDSVHEFDDGYEPTSLAAVLGCNAEDAADLESVLGQEAPDLSDGGGVSDSFLHSLVGPSPTVDDLNGQNNSVSIFDSDFHSPHESKQDTENEVNFHSNDFSNGISCEMVENTTNALPLSRQVRSLLRDANAISMSSHFGSPPGGSKSFNHFFEATSRRLNRSCRFTSDIDDDFIGVDFSDAVNECTTAEQFDEALMLLGPQPNSPINQSELHSENTIPVSVTDFVSHIEDKMNNENAAKDKSLLHIDCTDLKIVEVSDIQIAGSRNISPQHTVDKSVKSPISIKEFTSQNECIPSVKSPASEIKNCTIENGSKRDTTDDTMNHSVDSFCSINPANLVTVKSQHTVFDEDIIKHTDISITDDENLLSPDKKSELVDLSPSMSEELSVSGNNLTPPSQGKPNIQQPASVSSTLVACHYEVSQVTPSPNSTYSVCYNLARRPHSVSPRIPSNAKHISSSESSFYLPPRPQSLPNLTSLSQFDIVQEKENVESFISNPLSSCDITTSVACLLKSDIDFTNKELCSTFPSDHISLNTVDMISNISILGVLASSSALVEAVANLEDDSDISPIKSSIEGLASLDRMLKSCQRRSQQILNSTSHTSSGSESAIVSSSQTSSLSQSSAPKPISIHEASNNDVCNLEFSGWKNTDISSAPKHDDISTISLVNSDHSPNRSVDFEQREIKNVNTVNSKRGRRKRIGSRKPHFTYLKRNTLKTICKPNVPTLESRASQCIIEDSNEFHHFQNQSFGPPTKDVSTNDLLELVARRPHSFGLSSVEGKLSNVPNPPVSPEFESLLPPLILTTGASLFPDSRLHSDIYSLDDDSYSTIPSVHKLKVEPDEEPVTKANCERDLVSSSTPTQLRTHRRKKRKRHITDTKPRSKSQAGCHAVTESHPNPSHFDFHRNNFIGINSSDLRRFESLDEAPFERFLHDTKLQTFAALKSATIEITPKLKSNVSSWCDPNQNVLIFGRQYDNQSLSGDYDSVSAHNIESGNQFNETRSATEEVAECSSILSPRTNSNSHVFEEPVSTSSESNKSSIASHQLVFSTPVSHTFNTFPTSASFSCVSKSISPFQGHIMSLPITTTINQSNSLCDSSSSTSHSLEKVFPVVSPLPINRNLGITGSFAGAAAFRATSFSALAAKVEKKSGLSESLLNNPSETLWRNITFADLAKVASSESKSKEIPQTPNNIPSSLLCKSSWFVDKSLQIDASVLQPKPLFQSNFPIITTSSKSGDSSTMFPVNNSSPRTSPNQLNNQLPFSDMSKSSKSSLSKSHCSEGRKRSLNHMFSLPKRMNRRRRSAGRRQRRPYISTCKSTAEMIQDSPNDSNAKENNSVLNMDNISCHLVTTLDVETHDRCSDSEKLIIDYCDKPKMNNNLQCKNPPKSLRLDEASSPAHNIHVTQSSQAYSVPNVFPSSMLKETSMNPLSTKKIFSTARQERRSNYAQLTRPWRANLSTSPRKRSATAFRSVSSRRYVSNVTRSRSHLVNSYSGAPLADHKQLNVSCVPSIVPVNIFNKKTSNDDAEMYCDNSQSYSITNLTNIHNEFPNMERPESHPLRLVIRLGKSTNASKDELVHQSVISPLNVQVPSDMSSNSSQASSDMNRQDGSVNFTILPGQSNVGNDSSVQELSEFCIASEAETFMDPNQFQIHRILNRTLPMNSGLVGLYIPSPSGDDDEGDGCGMVERALDSEHRLRMTGQSFHFSQICHENHATPGAPHIGCTAGLSRRKETKPFKRLRHNKKNTKHARCGHGKHNNLSMDEHGLDQSSKLHAQCMKSFENHTNNDFTFLHDQPSSLSVHSTNISQPNSTNCNQIYNPDGFAHSSPEPMMNPAHFTKCKSDGNSDNTQMKFLWCNASATNKEKHHDLSALYRNEETVLSNCFSSNNVTVPSDQLSVAILKCHPKLLNDENNVYSDSAYSQQTFCNSTQTRVFEAYNNGSYTNGSSGSGFGGSCSHTGSANSIPAPSTGSPAPLSLGPAPGSQPEYSSNCTGSLNESFCGPLSPISVNRDFHCSPVSSRFDLSAPIYLENQPISHIPYSQCHENRLSGSVSSDRYVFNHFFI